VLHRSANGQPSDSIGYSRRERIACQSDDRAIPSSYRPSNSYSRSALRRRLLPDGRSAVPSDQRIAKEDRYAAAARSTLCAFRAYQSIAEYSAVLTPHRARAHSGVRWYHARTQQRRSGVEPERGVRRRLSVSDSTARSCLLRQPNGSHSPGGPNRNQ
jgi:hypothetical protein